MSKFLKALEDFFSKLKVDRRLARDIKKYKLNLINKSEDHINFYGGNLLGPDKIVFSDLDSKNFFKLLSVDMNDLRDLLHSLDGIYPERKVSSNVLYLTLLYLVVRFDIAFSRDKDYEDVTKDLYVIFAFAVMGSMYSNSFGNYPADRRLAEATYEKLSMSFILKKVKSWGALFDYRAEDLFRKNGLHYPKFKNLDPETAGKIIADMQGRLKDMFINIYSIMVDVKESGDVAKSISLVGVNEEGVEEVKDIINDTDKLIKKINNKITDKYSFIDRDFIKVTEGIFSNLKSDILIQILEEISDESLEKNFYDKQIIENIVIISVDYLKENEYDFKNSEELEEIIIKLKNFWSVGSVSRKQMSTVKKEIELIVLKKYKKNTRWVISSLVISTIVYILLVGLLHKEN